MRDIWCCLVLVCTEFANEIVEDELDGTRQRNGDCDFLQEKFVIMHERENGVKYNIMETNNVLRLAIVLSDGKAQNFKTNLRKIVKLVLFDNYGMKCTVSSIIDEIKRNYLLEFSSNEIISSINNDKGIITFKDSDPVKNKFELTPSEYQKIGERQKDDIDQYIALFLEECSGDINDVIDFETTKTLIYKYLYFTFNADTQTVLEFMNYNLSEEKVYNVSEEFSPEEAKVINTFLNWENSSKNEFVLNLIAACFDYCMLTVKKDTHSFASVFNGKEFFLDSNVIFRLAGFNKVERQNAIFAFISKCTKSGIKICYTNHTYEEIRNTIKYYVDTLKKTLGNSCPIAIEAMQVLSSKYANLDFYEKYVEWCKDKKNKVGDFEAFRIFLEKEIRKSISSFVQVVSNDYDSIKEHTRFKELMDDFTGYKNRHYKNTYEGAIKVDINNYYFMLEKNNRGQAADFMQVKYYFITADHCLTEWTLRKRPGTVPIFVLPSVWYSVLLKYKGRTDDDYKAFCQFLNIRIAPERDELLSSKQIMLSYIMGLNENTDIKEDIIYDIEERLSKPDTLVEDPIAFAEESHQTILQAKVGEVKREMSEKEVKAVQQVKDEEKEKHQLEMSKMKEEYKKQLEEERDDAYSKGQKDLLRSRAKKIVKRNKLISNILLIIAIIAGISAVGILILYIGGKECNEIKVLLNQCQENELVITVIMALISFVSGSVRKLCEKNKILLIDEEDVLNELCKKNKIVEK